VFYAFPCEKRSLNEVHQQGDQILDSKKQLDSEISITNVTMSGDADALGIGRR
jgi:hypothetical protein